MSALCRLHAASAAAALLLLGSPATAAPVAAAKNAAGSAIVLKSLSLLKDADLDFGEIVVTGAGTAALDPASGKITITGPLTTVGTPGHPATFTATGSRNSVVNIRLPNGAVTLNRIGGGGTMTVNLALDGNTNRKVPFNNTFDFNVGGTLNVGAGQPDGTYSGTFAVTVQYP